MKSPTSRLSLLILLALVLSACNLPVVGPATPDPHAVASMVAATLQSLPGPGAIPSSSAPLASPTAEGRAATVAPSPTVQATATEVPQPGTIEGTITGYPYGSSPQFTIVVYLQESPHNYAYLQLEAGATYFSISSSYIIPGTYQVVAYDTAGHAGGCTTLVKVKSNETANCNITDWSGSYRPKPAGAP